MAFFEHTIYNILVLHDWAGLPGGCPAGGLPHGEVVLALGNRGALSFVGLLRLLRMPSKPHSCLPDLSRYHLYSSVQSREHHRPPHPGPTCTPPYINTLLTRYALHDYFITLLMINDLLALLY